MRDADDVYDDDVYNDGDDSLHDNHDDSGDLLICLYCAAQHVGCAPTPPRAATFRPWLDPDVPYRPSIVAEVERRAVAEGAERAEDDWDHGDIDEDLDLVLDEADADDGDE